MTRIILPGLFILAAVIICPRIHAQELDLIVMNGDSIACKIDSISDSKIYFEMKTKGQWIHTNTSLENISLYEEDVINKKDYIFNAGTSKIKSKYNYSLQKNSVYLGIGTLCYGRTIPGNPVSFAFGLGIASPDGFAFYGEATLMIGRQKHYFETGFSSAFLPMADDSGFLGPIFRAGYRYQGPKGFLFRSAPTLGYIDGEFLPLPALSLGYSF